MSLKADREPVQVNCRDGRGWLTVTRYILHRDGSITWRDVAARKTKTTSDWRKANRES